MKSSIEKRMGKHSAGRINKPPAASGLRVRSNLRAGSWKCRDCSGKPTATGLYEAKCDLCVR